MTYNVWNCPNFSAVLGYFLEAGLDPILFTHML